MLLQTGRKAAPLESFTFGGRFETSSGVTHFLPYYIILT